MLERSADTGAGRQRVAVRVQAQVAPSRACREAAVFRYPGLEAAVPEALLRLSEQLAGGERVLDRRDRGGAGGFVVPPDLSGVVVKLTHFSSPLFPLPCPVCPIPVRSLVRPSGV